MPIYEFTCELCGNEFENIQSFSDNKSPHCPSCQSGQVIRRLGRPAIHFKGSGWYINDSKKSSERSSASGNGESKSSEPKNGEAKNGEAKVEKSSSEGESKAVSKSDSKPETPAAAPAPSTAD